MAVNLAGVCAVAVAFEGPSPGTVLLAISGSARHEQKVIFDQ